MRDIWEAIVFTGRRVNEVMKLRVECIGRYGGLPMLWHDQTKVGNLDAAIRIPERLFHVLDARQAKTVDRFAARHGHRPAGANAPRSPCSPASAATPTTPGRWAIPGSTSDSGPGWTPSTSVTTSRTRPGTPWPPTCCAAAPR